MRMGFLFSEVFWGVFLILIGLVIVIRVIFGIHIPLFKIAFSLFLIYLGVSVLVGGSRLKRSDNTVIFNDASFENVKPYANYDIVFGRSTIDLTKVELADKITRVKVNTVFGSSVVKINPELPVIVKVTSAFAAARFPDGNQIALGNYIYKTGKFSTQKNFLEIEANVVFGEMDIIGQ
jgi:predicted membrane protein